MKVNGLNLSNQWSDLTSDNLSFETKQFFLSSGVSPREFLTSICESGTLGLAIRKCNLNPIDLNPLISKDEGLSSSIDAAIAFAVNVAEGKLYERGIYGYEETKEDEQGNIIEKKRKYSDRALLEYLKANKLTASNLPTQQSYNVIIKDFEDPNDFTQNTQGNSDAQQ